jgi:periplasmic protein TonB
VKAVETGMVAEARGQGNLRKLRRRGMRLPNAGNWVSLHLPSPMPTREEVVKAGRRASQNHLGIAAVLGLAALLGAVVGSRDENREEALPDDVFVIEDQVPQPSPPEPPPVPPTSDPEPQPQEPEPEVEPEEEPPPQFGLTEDALGETGDLVVATGNTVMAAVDTLVKPPPPPLPPAPQLLDQPPRIMRGEAPQYPARALDLGLEGTVVALITTDTSGAVTEVVIEKSAGPDFDQAVLRASRATIFQPPVRQGRKAAARFRRPYEFRLE